MSPQPLGHRLFARYAHAPNALGYCGPATAAALEQVACGAGDDVDVAALARQFSGAWPYQQLIGELTGRDALSAEVGRSYWTGSALTDSIEARVFGEMLIARFAGQAGHYWAHLTEELLDEVTPTHAFHVLGVYPWSRLLPTGLPEPLQVLDSCRIRAGQVIEVDGDELIVAVDSLTYDGQLSLGQPQPETVSRRVSAGVLAPEASVGSWVAVHWGQACDDLTVTDAESLLETTRRQVELTNVRLGRELHS